MVAVQKHLTSSGIRGARRLGLFALLAVVSFAVAFGTLIPPPGSAHAGGYSPWLYLDCVETEVEEGDDVRLVVRTKHDTNAFSKTMQVFWYTIPDTTDEADYEHLYAEGQASNGHQSKTGKMGRDFHTLEDRYPEPDETFKAWFNNSVDYGTDGECYITITDDDGVGIHDLEIRSLPLDIPADLDGSETLTAYTQGNTILINARFTGDVTTVNPETREQADYAGLYIQVGENQRIARVLRGDGTDTLAFAYTVQADDVDLDGISVEDGTDETGLYYNEETDDSGIWPVDSNDGDLNRRFNGLEDDPSHPVAQVDVGEPIITQLPEQPLGDEPSIVEPPEPPLGEWAENAENIESSLLVAVDGELTNEDEGRDWYSFTATGGEDYIIELKSTMDIHISDDSPGLQTPYVPGYLIDPSILEVVNQDGEQVLGEHGKGGFLGNFARAFFSPELDETHYIAVGAGVEYRPGLGFYTLSIRLNQSQGGMCISRGLGMGPGV